MYLHNCQCLWMEKSQTKWYPNIPKWPQNRPEVVQSRAKLPPNLQKISCEGLQRVPKLISRVPQHRPPSPKLDLRGRSKRNQRFRNVFGGHNRDFWGSKALPDRPKMKENRPNRVPASAQNAQKMALQAASKLTHQVYEHSNQNIQILEQIIAHNNMT